MSCTTEGCQMAQAPFVVEGDRYCRSCWKDKEGLRTPQSREKIPQKEYLENQEYHDHKAQANRQRVIENAINKPNQ